MKYNRIENISVHLVRVLFCDTFQTHNTHTVLEYWLSHLSFYVSVCSSLKRGPWGFPGGAVVKNPPAKAGDRGSSPGLGRSHMPRSN